jgi:hypothetical protein
MEETIEAREPKTTKPLVGAAELPDVEAALEGLAAVLDHPHPLATPFSPVAHAFGHRGRSLWRGIRHAASGPSGASASALVRTVTSTRRRSLVHAVRLTSRSVHRVRLPWLSDTRERPHNPEINVHLNSNTEVFW